MAGREFDIVIYGATGFVGKLTADYLARAGGRRRIALAGRSPERLVAVRETLGESAQSWPILTADASSPSSLDGMAARTRVVVTTVGPYSRYGLPLVAACAAAGTDYADLTGEAMFVRQSIDDYPQAGRRHRGAHRACLRIRLRPLGHERLRAATGAPSRTGPGELRRHQLRGARLLRRGVRRHRRLDGRGAAGVLQRPGDPALLERPLHADPGPRRRARTRCPARPAVAARQRNRPGVGGGVDDRHS